MPKTHSAAQPLPILHDDSDLVAIDKPSGIAVIPGRDEAVSILELLAAQLGLPCTGSADPRLRVVHRLDKDTSGVLLFAKHTAAQRHLSHQFQNNTVEKQYLAIVVGKPATTEGEIDAPIGPHPASPKRMAVLKHGGRPARTQWKLEEQFRHHALLRAFPKTGKTHQIRVHLAHIGLPLAVDPIYNSAAEGIFLSQLKRNYRPKPGQPERPLISRLTLHAHRLAVQHPNGRQIAFESELPKDFRATLSQLRRIG